VSSVVRPPHFIIQYSLFDIRYSPFLGHPPSVLEFTPGAGFSVSLPGVFRRLASSNPVPARRDTVPSLGDFYFFLLNIV
jgi:hypothetical protein